MATAKFKTVDEYMSALPPKVKRNLHEVRKAIKQTAPEAEELISYNMPAFKYHGMLVYYAAHKQHMGFYPGSTTVITIFNEELQDYKTSKGAIQFPFEKQIPLNLIKKIIKYRLKQNLEKEEAKHFAKDKPSALSGKR